MRNPSAPKHPFEVSISIGANTPEYIERALEQLLETVRSGVMGCASGGWDGSYSLTVTTRDITPKQYRAELEAWRQLL